MSILLCLSPIFFKLLLIPLHIYHFLHVIISSALMLELQTICLKAILDRREGEKILELKNEELAALKIRLVDFMQNKGPLKKVCSQ